MSLLSSALQVLLDETRIQVNVELHQRRVTNRLKAMNLTGLDGARGASSTTLLRSAGVSPALLSGFDESRHSPARRLLGGPLPLRCHPEPSPAPLAGMGARDLLFYRNCHSERSEESAFSLTWFYARHPPLLLRPNRSGKHPVWNVRKNRSEGFVG